MFDLKILNWMMQSSINISEIYMEIEHELLKKVFLPDYKPALEIIHSYHSRHKSPPSYDVFRILLDKEGEDVDLSAMVETADCPGNEIGFYLDQIKERYNKYLIDGVVEKASRLDWEDAEDTVKDINDDLKKILAQTERLYKQDVFSEGNLGDSVQDRIDQYKYTSENPNEIMGFLSGYKTLDDYTWGVKNSEMLVIGGASSSGKSLLMLNMAVNAWLGSNRPLEGITGCEDGKNILFISLEMSKKQLEQRVDAKLCNARHRNLARGNLTVEEESRWNDSLRFQEAYGKKFYILDMPRGTTMSEIDAKYENIISVFKPDAVFVDYLQLMKPSLEGTGSDWLDVGRVSEELHEFCRKKNIPVITAAQRKAAPKKSGGKKEDNVDLEDLGRTKMIGDNATIVLLIANREDEILKDDMEIHIVKNRDGAKGVIRLRKIFDRSNIEEFPDDWTGDVGDENAV